MTFLQSLLDFKTNDGYARFDTPKQTTSAIVKELLPKQLTLLKKNYTKYIQLIDLLNYYVNSTIPKINTKAMLQSWVRALVKENYTSDSKQYRYLKTGFSMGSIEKHDREKAALQTVIEKNEHQIENLITVQQIKEFKDSILNLLENKFKIIPAIILLQLASGARLIELLSNEFKFGLDENEHYIKQSDVAKNNTDEARQVIKPVLFMDNISFLKLLTKVRENITHKTSDTHITLSNRYDSRVNSVIKTVTVADMLWVFSVLHPHTT
jgi:hypothetical protein